MRFWNKNPTTATLVYYGDPSRSVHFSFSVKIIGSHHISILYKSIGGHNRQETMRVENFRKLMNGHLNCLAVSYRDSSGTLGISFNEQYQTFATLGARFEDGYSKVKSSSLSACMYCMCI